MATIVNSEENSEQKAKESQEVELEEQPQPWKVDDESIANVAPQVIVLSALYALNDSQRV